MPPSSASTSRTCPVCGARNSGISLFCAECGSSLNTDVDRSGDTTAIPTPSSASRHTEAFAPISSSASDRQRWGNGQAQDETAPYQSPSPARTASTTTVTSGAFPTDPLRHGQPPVTVTSIDDHDRGARGFFLGLLAFILIAVVLGLYGWTAWLSADLRDTISGWFGFIG